MREEEKKGTNGYENTGKKEKIPRQRIACGRIRKISKRRMSKVGGTDGRGKMEEIGKRMAKTGLGSELATRRACQMKWPAKTET